MMHAMQSSEDGHFSTSAPAATGKDSSPVTSENTPTEPQQEVELLKYSDEHLKMILRFLAICMTKAETGLQRSTPEDKSLLKHPMFVGQMSYWRNVISAAKWFASLACKRQLHLGVDDDAVTEECIAQWMRLSQDLSNRGQ
jgi:hypothetical protein